MKKFNKKKFNKIIAISIALILVITSVASLIPMLMYLFS